MAEDLDPSTVFNRTVDAFFEEYFARYPDEASQLGLHAYDGRVTDFRPEAIADWLARVRHYRQLLAGLDRDALSEDQRLDADVLDLALDRQVFKWDELADWRRNPMAYVWPLDTSAYVKRDYAPLVERVGAVTRHLGHVPEVLAQARANLRPPLPATFVETSRGMFEGVLRFLETDLPVEAGRVGPEDEDGALLAAFDEARLQAIEAVADFVAYLDGQAEHTTDAFAIGEARFRRMLWTGEGVDVPLERLLEIGQADLQRNLHAFQCTAQAIDGEREPSEVIAAMSAKHPRKDRLVEETRDMLEELRDWIIEHELVSVPSDVRCYVEETPGFMRWAFAMMDAPGPFEAVAEEAFYYVTPPEDDWPKEQQEEWLTKFDYATLRDVSIHEAYPGHYVHFLHYRRTPGKVRRVFSAYSSWEAWAHYVEQTMIEAGYRPADLELRLAQLSEALRRNVRYICAIRMHTGGMTVDEATRMFVDCAFMAETPARQEAVRGTWDPGYLNYTLGKLMLLRLRGDYKAQLKEGGGSFRLRAFHDTFLSFGAPPVPMVRRAMLGEERGGPFGPARGEGPSGPANS